MGLFDFFRRKQKDPTIDEFARSLMKTLKQAGLSSPLSYDPAEHSIRVHQPPNTIFLTNYYNEYLQVPHANRGQYLQYRASTHVNPPPDIPEDFAEARPHLRPKIWSRLALEAMRLHIQAESPTSEGLDLAEYEIGSHLIAGIAYDLPEIILSVSRDNLEKWGITFYEALEIARENLTEQNFSVGSMGKSVHLLQNNDNYDACRLLIPTLFDKLPVNGDHIVAIPHRDLLIVTGSRDDKGLEVMLDLIDQAADHPRPILPIPLRRDGDAWDDWLPEPSHPLFTRFRQNEFQYLAQSYEQQREELTRFFEASGQDIFVSDYQIYRSEKLGFFSCTIWSVAMDFLLPKADSVIFSKSPEGPEIHVSWERVQAVLGHLLQPTEDYPPRFRVQSPTFPSEEQLARLATEAWK